MIRQTFFAVFAVLMLVLSGAMVGVAVADDHTNEEETGAVDSENDDEGNETDPNDYSIDELQKTGTHLSDAPTTSARTIDDRIFWWVHWPADRVYASPGEDSHWDYLDDGDRIDRNTIYFKTIRADDEPETVEFTFVFWTENEETRTIEHTNGETETVTERSAEVHKVETKEVTLDQKFVLKPVNLPQHDEPRQVTVFMDGEPQWRFSHKSVATTSPANISSMGDYWFQALIDFLLPIIFGLFVVGPGVKRAIDKAGIGPQWGYGAWMLLIGIVGTISLLWLFSDIAGLLVNLPWIAAVFVLALVAIVMLETITARSSDVLFYQPDIQSAVSPSGEDAVDQIQAEISEEKIVDMGSEGRAVVTKGLFPFLSRVFGGAAFLQGNDEIKSRVTLPDSKWDEVIFVHPMADEVLDYKPESWTWTLPTPSEDGWPAVVSQYVGVLAGAWICVSALGYLYGAIAAVIVAAFVWLRPQDGYARVVPAPTHMRSAMANMLVLTEEFNDAETLDLAKEELWKERVRSEKDIEAAIEDYNQTLVEEMFDSDVERSIADDLLDAVEPDQADDDTGGDDV